MRRLYLALFLFSSVLSFAQKNFRVETSKTTVEVGEIFELVYTISSKGALSGFSDEEVLFPVFRGFRELGTSQSSSISIINGKTTADISYIKTLQATKVGVFKIGSAKIKGKNKQTSDVITIKVVDPQNKSSQQPSANGGISQNSNNFEGTFVRWEPEKTNPYLYEGILLKLKLYTKDAQVIQSIQEIKPPKLEGFTTHTIKNENLSVKIETINREEFATVVLLQNIIFPQTTGKIKIESAAVGLSLYFNGFSNDLSYVNSNPITLQVKPLPPSAPKDFSGAVGQFKLLSSIDKTQLKKGESLSYEIEIIGTGNFDLMKMPEIQLTDSLEVFSPKEKQVFEATPLGLKGKNVSAYLFVPQFKGNFKIPAISFSYFDPKEGVYKTIQSENERISVSNQVVSKTENKENTIQFKSTWWQKLKNNASVIFSVLLIVILLILMIYLLNKRKAVKEEIQKSVEIPEIISFVPNKQFNQKMELNELQDLVNQNNSKLYYEKQESFINDWLLAKTGLPQSKLTIDSAKDYFLSNSFDKKIVNELEAIFNQSKEAKYASIFHHNHVNLGDDFNRLKNTINKF